MSNQSRQPKKNQHTVPQCYLRKFADHEKQLFSFNKLYKSSSKVGVKKCTSYEYFYDFAPDTLVNPDDDPQWAENKLSLLEHRFNDVLSACLAEADNGELNVDNASSLAHFVALQWLRTVSARKAFVEADVKLKEEVVNQLYKARYPEMTPGKFVTGPGYEQNIHVSMMLDYPTIRSTAERFWSLFWYVGRNCTDQPFYTSDTPVVRHRHTPSNDSPSLDPSLGLEFAFPLNSKFLLIMIDRVMLKHICKKPFDRYERKTVNLHQNDIERFNALQVEKSNQYVFCSEEKFALAKQVCDANASICDPYRERVKLEATPSKEGFGLDFLLMSLE